MSKLGFVLFFISIPNLCIAQDEVYVLFRGVHFTTNQKVPDISNSAYWNYGQDCLAPRNINSTVASAGAKALQKFRDSGPVPNHDETANFPSAYDWLQEYFVNEYNDMKKNLKNPSSFICSELKSRCLLNYRDIFLISTSLDPKRALKYATGSICLSKHRRYPTDEAQNVINPVLGFVDVFMIPVNDINSLYPYFVVEEFARHHIKIPDGRGTKTNYTVEEEVNFPFIIPGEYHVGRVRLDVSELYTKCKGKQRSLPFYLKVMSNWMNYATNKVLSQLKKTRVYLGPLAHSYQKRSYHLVPSEAVVIRGNIEGKILELANSRRRDRDFNISSLDINFDVAYALENLGVRGYCIMVNVNLLMASLRFPQIRPSVPVSLGEYMTLLEIKSYDDIDINIERGLVRGTYFGGLIPCLLQRLDPMTYYLLQTISPYVKLIDSEPDSKENRNRRIQELDDSMNEESLEFCSDPNQQSLLLDFGLSKQQITQFQAGNSSIIVPFKQSMMIQDNESPQFSVDKHEENSPIQFSATNRFSVMEHLYRVTFGEDDRFFSDWVLAPSAIKAVDAIKSRK